MKDYDNIPPLIAKAVEDMKRQGKLPKDFVPRRVDAEQKEQKKQRLSQLLDREELFRFAYVPFVIAQLVWDYLDTVTSMAAWMKLQGTKPLGRAIKELKREYDRIRRPFVDDPHQASEIENMYIFEDGVKSIFNLYLVNLRADLKTEYPDLEDEYVDYMLAVYQCLILHKSLLLYVERQTAKVQKIVGYQIGRVMPEPFYRLQPLIEAYIGDKPISERFAKEQTTYAKTLATQMALIGLSDEKLDKDN